VISIEKSRALDVREVIRKSTVADMPGAEGILRDWLYRSTEVRFGMVDGEIACVWGLCPPTLLSESAYLWLLTTPLVDEHKFLLVRHSQRYVEEALRVYPSIIGNVAIHNTSAIRWLKWLGASFVEDIEGWLAFTIRKK
jgi:hypothetical protein